MKRVVKLLAILIVAIAVGGGAAAAVLTGLLPLPIGPAAEARAAVEKTLPPVTVMYPTRERVVNLADAAPPRYLKAQVTLEFIDHSRKEPPRGEAVKAQQEQFASEMGAYSAIMEDALVTVLSSRTSAELIAPGGKEHLKVALQDQLNQALHGEEQVVGVYFTTFIIQ